MYYISVGVQWALMAVLAFVLVNYYSQKRVKIWVKFVVGIAWFLAFSIVAFLPLDVYLVRLFSCSHLSVQ